MSTGILRLDFIRLARVTRAGASSHSRLAWVCVKRVLAVKPKHVGFMVIPQTHHKDHATTKRFTHLFEASFFLEVIDATECLLLCITELIGNRIIGLLPDSRFRGLNDFTILNIETPNLSEVPLVSAIFANELSDHSEGAACVHVEVVSIAVEIVMAKTERIQVASIFIAQPIVALT